MKAVLTALAVVGAAFGVFLLREETITRQEPATPGTRMEVVFRIHTNRDGHDIPASAAGLFAVCRLQVDAAPVSAPTPAGDDTFVVTLSPTLDESDRRQLEGCIEDASIDHVQGDVLSLRRVR